MPKRAKTYSRAPRVAHASSHAAPRTETLNQTRARGCDLRATVRVTRTSPSSIGACIGACYVHTPVQNCDSTELQARAGTLVVLDRVAVCR